MWTEAQLRKVKAMRESDDGPTAVARVPGVSRASGYRALHNAA